MKIGKVLARTGFILFSALSLLLFQLANSILVANSNASAEGHFPTLAPNTVTLAPAIDDGTPVPAPISTLEPEDYFDEDDETRPVYEEIEDGDNWFGYAEVKDDPD